MLQELRLTQRAGIPPPWPGRPHTQADGWVPADLQSSIHTPPQEGSFQEKAAAAATGHGMSPPTSV